MAIRFNPNDSLLISGSVDSTIKVRDRTSGKILKTIKQPSGVTYLDISKNGLFIVSGMVEEIKPHLEN